MDGGRGVRRRLRSRATRMMLAGRVRTPAQALMYRLAAILVAIMTVMAVLATVVLVDSFVHWHRQMSENAMRELEAEMEAAQ
jgi:hypothetical protein